MLKKILRFGIVPLLLLTVLLAVTLLAYPHTTTHAAESASAQLRIPNVNIKVSPKTGEVIFGRKTLSCHAMTTCLHITNTTSQTIDLYLNGSFQFSMPPGDLASANFNFTGTDIFTIPNTNPDATLTVTVLP